MDKIYVVYAVTIHRRTEDELKRKFEITKLQYNKPEMKYEDFERIYRSFHDFEFSTGAEPVGYFTDLENARTSVKGNFGDINECGSYPYASIVGYETECAYPSSTVNLEEVEVYKYNRENDVYEQLFEKDKIFYRIVEESAGVIQMCG